MNSDTQPVFVSATGRKTTDLEIPIVSASAPMEEALREQFPDGYVRALVVVCPESMLEKILNSKWKKVRKMEINIKRDDWRVMISSQQWTNPWLALAPETQSSSTYQAGATPSMRKTLCSTLTLSECMNSNRIMARRAPLIANQFPSIIAGILLAGLEFSRLWLTKRGLVSLSEHAWT